ncbi:MAG: mannose-6-phosphate isomerase [Acidobacteriota bacterium]|nr:mannose-6-phosphate isomerase [Acidobacteriota bacterium]
MSQEREALGGRGNQQAVPGTGGAVNEQAVPGTGATVKAAPPGPMLLPANPVFRFYKGGAGIDSFRGLTPGSGPGAPEDWVGSTTTSFGSDSEGLATLADGRVLRDVIAADPVAFLGTEHVARLGANPGLLVKLLDAGERLAVHFHPDREFACEYLRSNFGKTEAWLILEAAPGAHMHLGLREAIEPETLKRWVSEQHSEEMLAALNEVPVNAGDSLFVPAGTLHTIGEGITLIELQEPSDMSVVIEWRHAGVKNDEASLRLGWETILPAADIEAGLPVHIPAAPAEPGVSTRRRLLPAEADAYFRAQLLAVEESQPLELEPQFAIVIGTGGALTISCEAHEPLTLTRGRAALIPFAAGRTTVSGNGSAIRCLPPSSTEPGAGAW